MDGPGLCQADGEAPESAVPPLCGTTRSCRRWQSGNERLLFLSGQACAPVPAQVCPPRQLCWGDLPSLDVHLIGRGAILHLTLAGGACGEEKHKGMRVNGEEDPWGACPASAPGPPGDGFMLALSLATPRPTPSSHQPSVPFLVPEAPLRSEERAAPLGDSSAPASPAVSSTNSFFTWEWG